MLFHFGKWKNKVVFEMEKQESKRLVSQKWIWVRQSKCYRDTFRCQEGLWWGHRKKSSRKFEKEDYRTCYKRTLQGRTALMWEGKVEVRGVQQSNWGLKSSPRTTRVQMLEESILQKNQICAFVFFSTFVNSHLPAYVTYLHLNYLVRAPRNDNRSFSPE